MYVIRMEDWASVRSCVIAELCAKYTYLQFTYKSPMRYYYPRVRIPKSCFANCDNGL